MADDVLTPEEMGDVLTPEELGGAPSPVPGLDVAPRPSRYPGPRPVTDADLGIESPIDYGRNILGSQRTAPGPYQVDGGLRVNGHTRPSDPMEVDPIAQAVVTSTVLGPLGRMATGALPRVLAPAVSALEGGAASKSMGGDFLPGFGLGGALGAAGLIARQMAPSAAAARAEARLTPDINRGASKAVSASKKLANDVKFQGNEDIAQVADELPEVGKALKTQAKTNPKAAHKVTTAVLDDLSDAQDADYAKIQRQHGGVDLQPIAERLAALEERLNKQGFGDKADAVKRVRTDWLKRYAGDPSTGLADTKLSAQQVRNMRNKLWRTADPTREMDPGDRRAAAADIARILNKEIEDVAADTRGVDLGKFRARNRQISTLIPVQKALADRVEKLADQEVKLKDIPGLAFKAAKKTGQAAVRRVDYGLSRIPIGGELAPGRLPVAVPVSAARFGQDQDFARKVTDGMGSGLSLQDAVSAAGGE
jgi:gas vesicle protein